MFFRENYIEFMMEFFFIDLHYFNVNGISTISNEYLT